MSAASTTPPQVGIERSWAHTVAIYAKETKYEFLKLLRLPVYSVSTIMFPVMFYVLFGLLLNRGHEAGGVSVAAYLMASYGTFGVMGASLFGFGVGVAGERGLGWLQVKRASPMPPFAYFVAKTLVCMTFSFTIVSALLMLGVAFGGVQVAFAQAIKLVATLVAGRPSSTSSICRFRLRRDCGSPCTSSRPSCNASRLSYLPIIWPS